MSEDNQKRDRQQDGQGQNDQQGSDEMTRESRGTGSEPQPNQAGASRPGSSPELDDRDEADDEDRDVDSRDDGSPNRRSNIS
jgi:hypothetical protein